MKFSSVYSFPEKVYLSGADCFFLMLESNAKKEKFANNVIRISLSFQTEKEAESLLESIQNSPFIHWLTNVELVQSRFYKKPYWKYRDQGKSIPVHSLKSHAENEFPKELLTHIISDEITCFDILF